MTLHRLPDPWFDDEVRVEMTPDLAEALRRISDAGYAYRTRAYRYPDGAIVVNVYATATHRAPLDEQRIIPAYFLVGSELNEERMVSSVATACAVRVALAAERNPRPRKDTAMPDLTPRRVDPAAVPLSERRLRRLRWISIAAIVFAAAAWGAGEARSAPATPTADPTVPTAAIRVTIASVMRNVLWSGDYRPSRKVSVACYPPAGDGGWWQKRGGRCIATLTIADDSGRYPVTEELAAVRLTRPGCTPARRPQSGGFRYPLRRTNGQPWRGVCLRGVESAEPRISGASAYSSGGGGSAKRPGPVKPVATAAQSTTPKVAAVLVRIIDGDTIVTRRRGAESHVRLLDIDTPETRGHECYAETARARLAARLPKPGRVVYLAADAHGATDDRYGRSLRYVYTRNASAAWPVQLGLVRVGAANPYHYRGHRYAYSGVLDALQASARKHYAGAWGACFGPTGSGPTTSTVRAWDTGS